MSDVYKWIDPFEEIERARQDGRDQVSALIEMDAMEVYPRLLHREVLRTAQDTAAQMIASIGLPKRIQAHLEVMVQRAIDAETAMLMAASGGVAVRTYVDDKGEVRMDMFGMDKLFRQ